MLLCCIEVGDPSLGVDRCTGYVGTILSATDRTEADRSLPDGSEWSGSNSAQ